MTRRIAGASFILGMALLLFANSVGAKDAAPLTNGLEGAATAGNPPRVVVSLSVARQGDQVTYSIALRNPGESDVKDIFLAAPIPPGTTFLGAGPNPVKSGFRAVEGGAAVFLSEVVPAGSTVGPFSYRVRLAGDTADAIRAWARWRLPTDGNTLSEPISVLPSVNFGLLASGSVDSLPQEPQIWTAVEVNRPAQFNEPGRTVANPRLVYIVEGAARTFGQHGVTGTYGPGSAHFIKPNVPFDDAVRNDAPLRQLVFTPVPSRIRAGAPPSGSTSIVFESADLTGLKGGPYNLLLLRGEFQPGGSLPTGYVSGPAVGYVLEGSLTVNHQEGSVVYGPGSFFLEQAGQLHSLVNTGNTIAKLLVAVAAPQGEPLITYTAGVSPPPSYVR